MAVLMDWRQQSLKFEGEPEQAVRACLRTKTTLKFQKTRHL